MCLTAEMYEEIYFRNETSTVRGLAANKIPKHNYTLYTLCIIILIKELHYDLKY